MTAFNASQQGLQNRDFSAYYMSTTNRQQHEAEIIEGVLAEVLRRMNYNEDTPLRTSLASRFLMRALPRFAEIMAEVDERVAQDGFRAAVNWLLPLMQMTVTSEGTEHVPTEGPLILASNHPGGADFCAIFSQVPRDDSHLVAATNTFDLLPNVVDHIIYSSHTRGKQKKKRGETTRKLVEKLNNEGSCLLLYPMSHMEPDPRWVVGSRACLDYWSESLRRFADAVPNLTVVPTLVSGSVADKALKMRWLDIYRNERHRHRTGVFTQIAMSMIRPKKWHVTPHVQFGTPIRLENAQPDDVRPHVLGELNRMITHARAPEWPIRTKTTGWFARNNKR